MITYQVKLEDYTTGIVLCETFCVSSMLEAYNKAIEAGIIRLPSVLCAIEITCV